MIRAVGYVRVSTDRQADHGISLDAQRAKLKAYAELYQVELVAIVEDAGLSAKSLDRPGLGRALSMLEGGEADALLVCKLDRLTRSVRDLDLLISRFFEGGRWALLSVGEQVDTRTAAGRLVLNVLSAVSQWEREAIGERTREAMAHKRARGEFTGGRVPYGYRVEAGLLVKVPAEQEVIAAARQARARGLSLRATAAELARRGFTTRRGSQFGPQQVKRMVAS